ncbi:hypothetical protein GCM10007160_04300 [Litchfieldella qijiaojingensis]|uniref:ABC-type transport auxiliary lipoprotein component domain-containing protein n=1 Tax=Litchfieldella qijiaojingensis TaxID=980347 RepID=A0ABQ2YFG8_9GAMM|nr:ABC-type transport auxiliary lipoprotein family protein [Halomonas qijiaojingensis]GGX79987.1 hypothetical protein GCM10007160_04300 [Halomonas qijiaojingensis]
MPLMRSLISLAALLLLAGCASTPSPVQRYTLPNDTEVRGITRSNATHTLVIRSLRLAHYLDGEGIVLQLDDITLNQAREHLWAEDLDRQLERGLRQRLAERLPDTVVLGADSSTDEALTLRLEVERFQGRYDGLAVASGQWQLRDVQGQLLTLEPFSAQSELDTDGYPALVRALGRSWDQVADRLAKRITELR